MLLTPWHVPCLVWQIQWKKTEQSTNTQGVCHIQNSKRLYTSVFIPTTLKRIDNVLKKLQPVEFVTLRRSQCLTTFDSLNDDLSCLFLSGIFFHVYEIVCFFPFGLCWYAPFSKPFYLRLLVMLFFIWGFYWQYHPKFIPTTYSNLKRFVENFD